MKLIIFISLGIILLIMSVLFFENKIGELVLEHSIRHIVGLDIDIGRTDVCLLRSKIDLQNIRIFNPYGFEERLMADIPRIYIDFDLQSLLTGPLRFKEIELNLKEFIVEKNRHGKVNTKSIKSVKPKREAKKTPSEFNIARLELTIGKVVYKDYSQKEPSIKEFNINIKNEVYTNIEDLDALVKTIVARALVNTTIASFVDVGMGALKKHLRDITKTGRTILKEKIIGEGGEFLKKAEDLLKGTLEFPYDQPVEEK